MAMLIRLVARLFVIEFRVEPQRQHDIDFYKRETDREDEEDEKQEQFTRLPEDDQPLINRNLIFEQPQFGD